MTTLPASNAGLSRRKFLTLTASTLGGAALLGSGLSMRTAGAASPAGYKALVCLYLNGGNDGFNWLVPTSSAAYSQYSTSRGLLALPQSSLLSLAASASGGIAACSDGTSPQYGLHPSCPELQALFNAGSAAFVCNVGTLIQPTTVAQARAASVPLPPQLFSHADQSAEWMLGNAASADRYGWAGLLADAMTAAGNSAKLAYNIQVGGPNYWQQGTITNPYALSTNGPVSTDVFSNTGYRGGARAAAAQALLAQDATDANILVATHAGIWKNSGAKLNLVDTSLSSAGDFSATTFPAGVSDGVDWGLSAQLHEVARVIRAQSQIGDARQLFFVEIGGFDTHDGELATQAKLLGFVSQYVNAFMNAMTQINMQNNVTLFTMSDFGRTLSPNNDGADHGWGNHHMVVGGAVQGGRFYGSMPSLVLGGINDYGYGRMVPTTSSDQYAATLATWFGTAPADLANIFPNLANFSSSNLGFMAAA